MHDAVNNFLGVSNNIDCTCYDIGMTSGLWVYLHALHETLAQRVRFAGDCNDLDK